MKPIIPFALLGALLVGAAQAASTTPVGYETLSLAAGTNYIGLRLHESTVVAGTVDTITATNMTDAAVDFGATLTGGATTWYIVEFENAGGVIQEVTGASASGSTLTLPQNVTASVTAGTNYRIRKAATLASVFGTSNSAGLVPGFFGTAGADIVAVPNGSGGFNQYYYDGDQTSWADATANPVNAASVPLVHVDGVVMIMTAPLSVTVTGEVKTKAVSHFVQGGTNYLSSIFPAGATLGSAFGSAATIATLDPGFFGTAGADLFLLPNGSGGFNQFYYDGDQTSFADGNANPIDPATVPMPSGFVFVNQGAAFSLLDSPPSSYGSL